MIALAPDTKVGAKRTWKALRSEVLKVGYMWEGWDVDSADFHIPLTSPTNAKNELLHTRTLDFSYEQNKERVAAYDKLCEKYPNDLAILAQRCRIAIGGCGLSTLDEAEMYPEHRDMMLERWREYRPERLRLIALAKRGGDLAPNNAFFPMAAACAWEAEKNTKERSRALARAAKCKSYEDYQYETEKMELDEVERLQGRDVYWRFMIEGYTTNTTFMNPLARRLSRFESAQDYIDRGAFAKCSVLAAAASSKLWEFQWWNYDLGAVARRRKLQGMRRSLNVGDLAREGARFQDKLANLGKPLTFDVPAVIGLRATIESSSHEIDTRLDAIYEHPMMIRGAAETVVALTALALFVIVFAALSLLRAPIFPLQSIPALTAFSFSLMLMLMDTSVLNSYLLHFTFGYAVVFAMAVSDSLRNLSHGIGIALTIAALAIGVPQLSGQGYDVLPAATYIVGLIRFLWLQRTGPSKLWLIPFVFIVLVGLGSGQAFLFGEGIEWKNGVVMALVLLFATITWQSVYVGEAARQLLKATPYAILLGVLAFGYFTYRQSQLDYTITELHNMEDSLLHRLKNDLARCTPVPD